MQIYNERCFGQGDTPQLLHGSLVWLLAELAELLLAAKRQQPAEASTCKHAEHLRSWRPADRHAASHQVTKSLFSACLVLHANSRYAIYTLHLNHPYIATNNLHCLKLQSSSASHSGEQ